MDIHRSRFVPYPSSPINALAFSRSSDKNLTDPRPALKLALGRANGDIEIWNADKGNWVQETTFPGGEQRSVDALTWIQEPDDSDVEGKPILGQLRLFSIGSTPAVTEWKLDTGLPLRASTGNFSEVWCFAAQPRWRPSKASPNPDADFRGQNLVAGTGDGTLAILSTADDDLVFKRFLARSGSRKARCMSVTWQNRDVVVAGFTDSTIRVYDTRSGSMLRNLSLGAGIPGAPRDTLVWRVKCLPNGDIVSGDSNGEVRIWDGRTYTLSQRLMGHESDCLELVTSSDGQTIFSGGMDGRLAIYKVGPDRKSWNKASQRRMHEGDIKAMAVYDAKNMSVVVSGGLDTTPVVTPLRNYAKEHHRRLPGLPQTPTCASAPSERLLVSWWDREISIWRINTPNAERISPTPEGNRKLVARIAIKGSDSIVSAAISHDGSLLVASTLTSIKLFHLRPTGDALDDRLRIRKLTLPTNLERTGARLVTLSPNGYWLSVVTPESEVHVARLEHSASEPRRFAFLSRTVELERSNRKVTKQTGLRKYDRTITRVAFSPDSSVLVAGDLSGYLDTWVLEGHFDSLAPAYDSFGGSSKAPSHDSASSSSDSDSDDDETIIYYGQHWADNRSGSLLPKLDSAPLSLSFRPSATTQTTLTDGNPGVHATRHNPHARSHATPTVSSPLLVITAQHQVYELDVLAGKLTDWSRTNPTAVLPAELRTIKDRCMGVVWDVDERRARAWLYGSSWVGMLDLSQNYNTSSPENTNTIEDGDAEADGQTPNKKRKRRESGKWDRIVEQRKKAKGGSGAGDKVRVDERRGDLDDIKRIEEAKAVEARTDTEPQADLDNEDALPEDMAGPLRRRDGDEMDVDGQIDGAMSRTDGRRKWWCTYRYRPILGMVPIGGRKSGEQESDENSLEAVLVERPLWDLPHLQELGK